MPPAATGAGNISITDPNAADTLTIAGETTTGAGTISLSNAGAGLVIAGTVSSVNGSITATESGAGDLTTNAAITSTSGGVTLSSVNNVFTNANINAGSGMIAINADTAGSGTAGFTQGTNFPTQTITSTSGVTITVNTAGGGTGNATIYSIVDGGTLTINSNGGSILYAGTVSGSQLGTQGGGTAPPVTQTAVASNYVFTATGAGSIGTSTTPIQATGNPSATGTFSAGGGGVYFVDWGSGTLTLNGAAATGAGNVLVVTGTGGTDNLTVNGAVTTGSGSILLAADDNLVISAAVGGSSFSGTVYLGANRDQGNAGLLTITAATGSITTTNATPNAVLIEDYGGVTGTVAGTLTLGNITVGNGGTITATTVPTLGTFNPAAPTSQGQIIAGSASVVLNAGAAGTVVLTAAAATGTTDTVGIGTPATPIVVSAGTVDVTNTSSINAATDSVYVTGNSSTTFTATVAGTVAGSINLNVTSGTLAIAGATTAGGGAISATNTVTGGGITVSGPLGSSTSGPITLNAGTNNVAFTTSAQSYTPTSLLTITAGNAADFQTNLGLTGTSLAGGTNGILIDTASTLSWGATGATITGPVAVSGMLVPSASSGTLNTGNLTLTSNAITQVTAANIGAGNFTAINVNGAATLAGNLQVSVTGANLAVGNQLTILSATSISGNFANASSITATNNASYTFSASVVGNTVVLMVTGAPTGPTSLDVTGGIVSFTAQGPTADNVTVAISGSNYVISDPGAPIVLTANATNANWSNMNANTVIGPTSGITSLSIDTASGIDSIAGIAAGTADVALSGFGNLTINGAVTTSGNLSISGYNAVDFESSVTASTSITISGVTNITDGAASTPTPGTLNGGTISLTAAGAIGTPAKSVLTSGATITASAGAGGIYLAATGSANVTAGTTAAGNISITDPNAADTLTIAGASTTGAGTISLSNAGAGLVIAGAVTSRERVDHGDRKRHGRPQREHGDLLHQRQHYSVERHQPLRQRQHQRRQRHDCHQCRHRRQRHQPASRTRPA